MIGDKQQQTPNGTLYKAVVIGGSAGGSMALEIIFSVLPSDFLLPVLIVQHLHVSDDGSFSKHIARISRLPVIEPCDKEPIKNGYVYTAPANYHMLVESDGTIGLSVDDPVKWSRPSIDVLFESAVRSWREALVAVILSGTNNDGSEGMRIAKKAGSLTIAQNPVSAEHPVMPQAVIDTGVVCEVLYPVEIGRRLVESSVRYRNDLSGHIKTK